jgi:hypothetical protein
LACVGLGVSACQDGKVSATTRMAQASASASEDTVPVSQASSEALTPLTVEKPTQASAPKCELPNILVPTSENLPELDVLRELVKDTERDFKKPEFFKKMLRSYFGETASLRDEEFQVLVEQILALPRRPKREHPLHSAITAYILYREAFDMAHSDNNAYHVGLDMKASEAAQFASRFCFSTLENLAIYTRAFKFAGTTRGLGMSEREAQAFAESVLATPDPVQTFLQYMLSYHRELDRHSSRSEAQELAAKEACLK